MACHTQEKSASPIYATCSCFFCWLSPLCSQTLLRHGLLPSILTTMLSIMASHKEIDEEDDLEEEDSNQSQSPTALAAQVLASCLQSLLCVITYHLISARCWMFFHCIFLLRRSSPPWYMKYSTDLTMLSSGYMTHSSLVYMYLFRCSCWSRGSRALTSSNAVLLSLLWLWSLKDAQTTSEIS